MKMGISLLFFPFFATCRQTECRVEQGNLLGEGRSDHTSAALYCASSLPAIDIEGSLKTKSVQVSECGESGSRTSMSE
jgi:hypothetical protein